MYSRKNVYIDKNLCKIILASVDANAKLFNFTKELKTASGKSKINTETGSFLSFALNL